MATKDGFQVEWHREGWQEYGLYGNGDGEGSTVRRNIMRALGWMFFTPQKCDWVEDVKDVREIARLASPAPKPQALAWEGSTTLWMGSRETKRIYAINPVTWTVDWETSAPGTPYGMTVVGRELRVLCGETADDRIVRRCIPHQGFDAKFKLPCPDDTGSQLGFDGRRLFVSQWYPQKLIELGDDGRVENIIAVPHQICGQVCVEGCFYLVTTDDESTDDYWLTRVDARSAVPNFEDLARIPFAARALAFDGKNFWTNHREQNEIVSFSRP